MGEIMTTCELREKEVVNISDGARLGYPSEFEFDSADGRIRAIILPKSGGFFGFFNSEDIVIPWNKIERIGSDTILVRLQSGDILETGRDRNRKNL